MIGVYFRIPERVSRYQALPEVGSSLKTASTMSNVPQHWILVLTALLGACCLWRTVPTAQKVLSKTSIHLDVSLPPSRVYNTSTGSKHLHRGTISRYMLQLYRRRPSADIIRALQPVYVSGPVLYLGGGRILEFRVPEEGPGEVLQVGELLATAGMVMRVKYFENSAQFLAEKSIQSRKDESWRAFDVTRAVRSRSGGSLRFLVRGKVQGRPQGEGPILLLSYAKPRGRQRRSTAAEDDVEENPVVPWPDSIRRRRKNPCRRRPLYVDFAKINYDDWVVAPPGYDAYQCAGRCFFPFGDHLSPTKHAIVQALVHGALQGVDSAGKPVSRVCCVPTRLAPTSLLYLDSSGTLTYQYGYEDMVVVECGCR